MLGLLLGEDPTGANSRAMTHGYYPAAIGCRYYYNKWMTQRIHTALLELHLGCSLGSGTSQQLLAAAEAAADEPAIAAAAAAAGFITLGQQAAAAAQAALPAPGAVDDSSSNCSEGSPAAADGGCISNPSTSSNLLKSFAGDHQQLLEVQQLQQGPLLQLPEPVVSKLLSLDAGDLGLMIQHPAALQAQVFEWLQHWHAGHGEHPLLTDQSPPGGTYALF
jgi:hypothetical protein